MNFLLIFPLFSFLSEGIKIECEYQIILLETIGDLFTCHLVSVEFCASKNFVTESDVKGTHLPNYSNNNMSGFATGMLLSSDCSKFHLTFIPKGIFQILRHLDLMTAISSI
jgi:hypothetical protein